MLLGEGQQKILLQGQGAHATSRMPKPREPRRAWSNFSLTPGVGEKKTSPPRVASHRLLLAVQPMFCTRRALHTHSNL